MAQILGLILLIATSFAGAAEDLSTLHPLTGRGFVKSQKVVAGGMIDLQLELELQEGFFAYQDRFQLKSTNLPDASVGELFISPIVEFDDTVSKKKKRGIHKSATLNTQVQIPAQVPEGFKSLAFELSYIACTKKFCLTPRILKLSVPIEIAPQRKTASAEASMGSSAYIQNQIDKNLAFALVLIFMFGILTSLTPCVYPLIPITMAVLGTSQNRTKLQSFAISLVYVFGIGITYAILGVIAAQTGQLFGSLISHPAVIIAMSLIFFLMGLSLLGVFEIQAPAAIRNRYSSVSTPKGFGGAFISGLLAGVIASPCVGPVLVGVLAYIAETQNSFLGFILLFTFAMGFGILFILLGTFSQLANKIPRSGAWMNTVKYILAFALFGLSFYYSWPLIKKQIGVEQTQNTQWQKFSPELVEQAKADGKAVIIDFFADWCAACVELDQFTFSKDIIIQKTANIVKLKVDATAPTDDVNKLSAQYKVFGLPTIIFIDTTGTVREDLTLTGFEEAPEFSQRLDKLLAPAN